ncbi:hypothetical protein FOA52_003792 [Chlamydomonas sp. UWO 241]|nr:hypothetical protein FOA52_003792 [Chlamydomonas sp. UWO 241]
MTRSKARKHSAAAGALIARAATTTESPAQAQQIASLVDVVSLLVSRVPGAPMQMPHAEPARARAGHAAHSAAPRAAPAAEAAQPARPAAAAAPVASAAGTPAAERPAAAGAARAASARGPSRRGGLPARVGETSLCRSHVLSIPVAVATRLIAGRGSEGQMARDGIVRGALRDASYLGFTRHVRRLFSDCYGSEETAVAAAAVRVAAAAVDGVSLPVCLAMNLVRFVHDVSGRDRPAGGGVVSALFLNAKPAVGGIGVEPRRGGVLRVLFTVASDAVADTVVRSRRNLRDVDPSAAVFDVLSDREEAQHRALWPAFLAAKAAGKRAQFHRARLVVDGERAQAQQIASLVGVVSLLDATDFVTGGDGVGTRTDVFCGFSCVAAVAAQRAADGEAGVSLPVRLATNIVRFVHDDSGRWHGPAGGGVVSASFLNAKPAVGGIGVEPRGAGVLRVLFTVTSDAVADTVVRWRRSLRQASVAVFDVLSDREEAQHQALWPAFLAAKAAGKRAQFHRARLVVDGERVTEAAARSAGVEQLYVHMVRSNDPAVSLYRDALGFEAEAEEGVATAQALQRPTRMLLRKAL